jgi:hypothetical protein
MESPFLRRTLLLVRLLFFCQNGTDSSGDAPEANRQTNDVRKGTLLTALAEAFERQFPAAATERRAHV